MRSFRLDPAAIVGDGPNRARRTTGESPATNPGGVLTAAGPEPTIEPGETFFGSRDWRPAELAATDVGSPGLVNDPNLSARRLSEAPAVNPQQAGNIDRGMVRSPLTAEAFAPGHGDDPINRTPYARPGTYPIAFTIRPYDKWAAWPYNGDHGVIRRRAVTAPPTAGGQQPTGGARRMTYRPQPQPWAEGAVDGSPGGTGRVAVGVMHRAGSE